MHDREVLIRRAEPLPNLAFGRTSCEELFERESLAGRLGIRRDWHYAPVKSVVVIQRRCEYTVHVNKVSLL